MGLVVGGWWLVIDEMFILTNHQPPTTNHRNYRFENWKRLRAPF